MDSTPAEKDVVHSPKTTITVETNQTSSNDEAYSPPLDIEHGDFCSGSCDGM